ncbi:type II toxin-antitoxin system VapC family toxin [bacterium]|nr:type II toxin-antitoxin system VapC family toxin [bacterium]MBU1957168.1 type II toxin-antitoxin system VapC family toxin [bacterium]
MIVLDTNVLIEILKGNTSTIKMVQSFNEELVISSISVMELYYGAINKAEIKKLEKFVSLFKIKDLDESISIKSTHLVKTYAKSHNLDIPDSLIASTALVLKCRIFTYNLKDFKYIDGVELVEV